MKIRLAALRALGLGLLALVAGCSLLAPTPEVSEFYLLTPVGAASAAPPSPFAPGVPVVIGLGPIKFPDYLERSEVVTRVAPNRIDLSATERWAEPLDQSFREILARDLASRLPNARLIAFPWAEPDELTYRVGLRVDHFERDATGGTRLAGRWEIRPGRGNGLLAARAVDFSESVSAAPGVSKAIAGTDAAAALSRDIGDLSTQIAIAIVELQSRTANE